MSFMFCFLVSLPSMSEKTIQENTGATVSTSNEIDTVKQYNKVLSDSLERLRKKRAIKGVSIHRRISKVENQLKSL